MLYHIFYQLYVLKMVVIFYAHSNIYYYVILISTAKYRILYIAKYMLC